LTSLCVCYYTHTARTEIYPLSLHDALPISELERKRVAAELHDGPVQHLTAFDVTLESLRDRVARADSRGAESLVDQLQGQIRKRSEEHTSELQSLAYLVCRLLLEKKKLASI